ncbi:MAG: hypothetical protein A2945_01320 [Candidatus Liptonbacteria bacterium RIFCSPLOWO2_01_FULL_52_25]|uniref:DUF4015 domain-containing protein n=1 Tax=Candidatus Liptonbacteria bacterium RIFCSPLOWO2_01_FULL_52_25 TaxID=1798650 RepID=A0A1G2CFQ1_9BACT|nr:MAG: hypothetical protein A2945_01320 [Candidatus Liptonbacteria bacterium RIFCSPLOWO2_01_FULL_52_25]
MKLLPLGATVAVFGAVIFLFTMPRTAIIDPDVARESVPSVNTAIETTTVPLAAPEAPVVPSSISPAVAPPKTGSSASDLPLQAQLQNPPEVAKGIYVTGWSAGSASKINSLLALAARTEVNAMVVDIKDFSGHVSYRTGIPEVMANGAENEIKILQPNALIKKLHDAGIYVIGRITVFQDPILAKAHPEWALQNAPTHSTSSGQASSPQAVTLWKDNKGLAWMDAAAKSVWDYNIAIANDAFARGFDEIQFDYIRFASDGVLSKIAYPYWDKKTPRATVIRSFFKYLREQLAGKKISADLFGLTTIDTWDDLGIGQVIEDAYLYFDYVSPMVYPSHYAAGFNGYKNPAAYPYEVVQYSMEKALARLTANSKEQIANSSSTGISSSTFAIDHLPFAAKLRPWLQDFDLGATYDAAKVRAQIQATYDALLSSSTAGQVSCPMSDVNCHFGGWLLWDPANTYTEGALEKK